MKISLTTLRTFCVRHHCQLFCKQIGCRLSPPTKLKNVMWATRDQWTLNLSLSVSMFLPSPYDWISIACPMNTVKKTFINIFFMFWVGYFKWTLIWRLYMHMPWTEKQEKKWLSHNNFKPFLTLQIVCLKFESHSILNPWSSVLDPWLS